MAGKSNYLENCLIDWKRGTPFPNPPKTYVALLTSTSGPREDLNGQKLQEQTGGFPTTISVSCTDGKVHLYRVTGFYTAGVKDGTKHEGFLAASATGLYAGTADGVVVDGDVELTECDSLLDANDSSIVREPPSSPTGNYLRACSASDTQAVSNAATDWTSTNPSAPAGASNPTGTSGLSANAHDIKFEPPPSVGGWGNVWGYAEYDKQLPGGNLLYWGPLLTVQKVSAGNSVSFLAGQIKITEG